VNHSPVYEALDYSISFFE